MQNWRLGAMACSFLLLSATSCSKPKITLPTVPASGSVTLDGQPFAGGTVIFNSLDRDGKPANGTTDNEGRFALKTFLAGNQQADGALPGEYVVTITKYETPAMSESEKPDFVKQQQIMDEAKKTGKPMVMPGAPQLVSPAKYADPQKTDLKATVGKSGNDFKFELKSEAGAQ